MRRLATATLAGLTVFGLVNGLAASMTVTGDNLGADSPVTAACDDAMTMSFGVTAGNASEVSKISFSGVDASCDLQKVYIDVLDASGGVLTSQTGTVALSAGVFEVTLTAPQPAASVGGANVTITGPDAVP